MNLATLIVAARRRRMPASPAGFTLTEVLVVIAIIASLMALLTPTLMRTRRAAMDARVKSEVDLLHVALMNYKNEYGSFPPANMGPVPGVGLLWENNRVNPNHPVYRHLVRVFPRIAEATTGANSPYRVMAQMSPAQALVFWLRGFYPNQEYPLTNLAQPGKRNKLYDFDEARLYAATPYFTGQPQMFRPRSEYAAGSVEREFPVYFTSHPTAGLPYVYFDSRCYDVFNSDFQYLANDSVASPYFTSDMPANPLWSQLHVHPDTFQLIAPGSDGTYGKSGDRVAFTPVETGVTCEFNRTQFVFKSPEDPAVRGHADNITNFAAKPLAQATETLRNQQ